MSVRPDELENRGVVEGGVKSSYSKKPYIKSLSIDIPTIAYNRRLKVETLLCRATAALLGTII